MSLLKLVDKFKDFQRLIRIYNNNQRFYKFPEQNEIYPSVTTILQIIDKPGLKEWQTKTILDSAIKRINEDKNHKRTAKEKKIWVEQIIKESIKEPINQIDNASKIGVLAHKHIDNKIPEIIKKKKEKKLEQQIKLEIEKEPTLDLKDDEYQPTKILETEIEVKELKVELIEVKDDEIGIEVEEEEVIIEEVLKKDLEVEELIEEIGLTQDQKIMAENASLGFDEWYEKVSDFIDIELQDTKILSKKYGYCGALDTLARKKDGSLVVMDWKTSNYIRNEHLLQISAYANAVEEITGEKVSEAWVVKLNKNKRGFECVKVKNLSETFNAFLAALQLWRYCNPDNGSGRISSHFQFIDLENPNQTKIQESQPQLFKASTFGDHPHQYQRIVPSASKGIFKVTNKLKDLFKSD